jgi:Raf kinase inhibitor-like YbhB/YbcL family protein
VGLLALLAVAFSLSSPDFRPNGLIPPTFTCDGANARPALAWTAPPKGTRSIAVSVLDPDAPSGTFTHWLAWNISAKAHGLSRTARPPREGVNDAGGRGWTGPCPPSGTHRYVFRLYALRSPLPVAAGADRTAFTAALKGRVIRMAVLVGRYRR